MKNFTRLILVGLAMMTLSTISYGQRYKQFKEGQSDLNVGIGFVAFGLQGDVSVPPVSVSYEYGVNDKIGVGIYAGYTASTFDYASFGFTGDAPTIDFTYLMIAARGSYHFKLIDNFDTYVGLMVGYNAATIDFNADDFPAEFEPAFDVGGVLYGFHAGARYHFTDNLGAFLEIGYGVSAVNLGLAVKF